MSVDMNLVEQIKDALREDLSNFDDDWEPWSENAIDCPSEQVESLLAEIPEDECDLYYDQHIYPYINSLQP